MIVIGGVIPPDDVPTLQEMGAAAVFLPGTVIAESALDLLAKLRDQLSTDGDVRPALVDAGVAGIRARQRAAVSRAITLVESSGPSTGRRRARAAHRARRAGRRRPSRVGISGVPGVGKSTFIEALGSRLTADGPPGRRARGRPVHRPHRRLGARRQDPDGPAVGRPERLHPALAGGRHPRRRRAGDHAGDGGARGGGYDVVLVETVGVGQSEVTVAGMVDTFLFLTLARTGDQLQGIKKGILEIADVIAVNKADGDREQEARVGRPRPRRRAAAGPRQGRVGAAGRHLLGLTDVGVDEVWERVLGAPRAPRRRRTGRQARRPAARLHLGAGPRRARPAAAPLARRSRRSATRSAPPCWPASCPRTWPPTGILAAYDRDSPRAFTGRAQRPILPPSRAELPDGRCPRRRRLEHDRGGRRGVRGRAGSTLRRDLHAHPELSLVRGPHHRRSSPTALEQAGWRVTRLPRTGLIADHRRPSGRRRPAGRPGRAARPGPHRRSLGAARVDRRRARLRPRRAHHLPRRCRARAGRGRTTAALLPGRVRLLFQPAEEVMPGGALQLIARRPRRRRAGSSGCTATRPRRGPASGSARARSPARPTLSTSGSPGPAATPPPAPDRRPHLRPGQGPHRAARHPRPAASTRAPASAWSGASSGPARRTT